MTSELLFKINDGGFRPTRATKNSAGWDLYAAEDVEVEPHKKCLIPTRVEVRMPIGYYGRINGRSGLTLKKTMMVDTGVIDLDYRGEMGIIATAIQPFTVKRGERVAQLVIEKCYYGEADIVSSFDEFDKSGYGDERGDGGFGSTGV